MEDNHHKIFEETDCLSPEAIRQYHAGKLTGPGKLRFEKHLVDCPLCADAVEGLALSEDAGARIKAINERIRVSVSESRPSYFRYAAAITLLVGISAVTFILLKNSTDKQAELISEHVTKELPEVLPEKTLPEQEPEEQPMPAEESQPVKEDMPKKEKESFAGAATPEKDVSKPVTQSATLSASSPEGKPLAEKEEAREAQSEAKREDPALYNAGITITDTPVTDDEGSDEEEPAKASRRKRKERSADFAAPAAAEMPETKLMKVAQETDATEESPDSIIPAGKEEVFVIVEDMPEFPGGQEAMTKYLSEEVEYPEEALDKGITGTVHVQFIVRKDGRLDQAEILRGVHPLLDEEALRAIREMPDWVPGKQRGKKVDVRFVLPVRFRLDK